MVGTRDDRLVTLPEALAARDDTAPRDGSLPRPARRLGRPSTPMLTDESARDRWLDVSAALGLLIRTERTAIVLVALNGVSYDDAAGLLDDPRGTASRREPCPREAGAGLMERSRADRILEELRTLTDDSRGPGGRLPRAERRFPFGVAVAAATVVVAALVLRPAAPDPAASPSPSGPAAVMSAGASPTSTPAPSSLPSAPTPVAFSQIGTVVSAVAASPSLGWLTNNERLLVTTDGSRTWGDWTPGASADVRGPGDASGMPRGSQRILAAALASATSARLVTSPMDGYAVLAWWTEDAGRSWHWTRLALPSGVATVPEDTIGPLASTDVVADVSIAWSGGEAAYLAVSWVDYDTAPVRFPPTATAVYRSADAGRSWARASGRVLTGANLYGGRSPISIQFADATHGWLQMDRLYVTSDGGPRGRLERLRSS